MYIYTTHESGLPADRSVIFDCVLPDPGLGSGSVSLATGILPFIL